MKERPIIFNGEMVKAILDGRKRRKKLYGYSIPERLANGLDAAPINGCWIWKRTHNGYGYGTLTVKGKSNYAHRLAYVFSKGPISPGMHVCHRCDNPGCINPDHLFLGTPSDNMKDCYQKGRSKIRPVSFKGEQNPGSKLTKAQIAQIRTLLDDGVTQRLIADSFKISQAQVSNINRGTAWA